MAAPPSKSQPKNTASASDDLDMIPMSKTSPLVYVGIVAGVVLIGGAIAYATIGRSEKPSGNVDEAVASARVAAMEAKQKEAAQREHLELAAKAFAVADEKTKAEAAAAAAASAAAAEAEASKGGGAVAGGTPGAPPRPKGPSGNEVDELDKLGSATNSELGGK